MQIKVGVIALAFAFVVGLPLAGMAGPNVDTDGDTIIDPHDNCVTVSNSNQKDSNTDGYGNRCDCDFGGDNVCGVPDFFAFQPGFGLMTTEHGGTFPADRDMTCDSTVGVPDFFLFQPGFGTPPGPSGLPCAGVDIPCTAN
jgi:hypothetical protein